MNKYICWYAYQGHETEGHLSLNEPQKFEANNEAEAVYKYLCITAMKEKREPYHKTLTEHMRSQSPAGGWGYHVMRLHDDEKIYPNEYFERFYQKFNH